MASNTPASELPLFPRQTVLFRGGLLSLKVFEARYVDLVIRMLREQRAFGVVALRGSSDKRQAESRQQGDGVWRGETRAVPNAALLAPTPVLLEAVRSLVSALTSLTGRGSEPFLTPHRFEEAGGIANRWCEILQNSSVAKHKLMELPDPIMRLQLVDDFLRSRGVVK